MHGTWQRALVGIPAELTPGGSSCTGRFASEEIQACLKSISPERKHPLVLFLHGCAGLRGGSRNAITTFRSLGYAVIAPDSFARPGREVVCKGRKPYVMSLRAAEIEYALEQISTLEWADQSALVLAGFSEGGIAVSEYRGGDAFRGYIILGWDCRRGILPSGPVLAIQGALDPISSGASCGVLFRKSSESIIVPRAGHDVSGFPETDAALRRFLGTVAPLR